jgi:Transcription termination and cleavage factor C-terminal
MLAKLRIYYKAMLLQVLRLTQEQISQLPPAERDAILALVSQPCKIGNRF